ncbi:uncharacterized protein E0L32_005285 [Thyridium curvatum]|uniref:Uncharacterized protein n=1 Tax=Thyridium curvatum TaxID=1093900 RepID=A0A507B428_9PEZI|nr:uncharacterized protein E0L32_005285 [Thyridium curvatum]TPX14593.1 hypothetical protein E0L32_005285 [Thyridium curvatum]
MSSHQSSQAQAGSEQKHSGLRAALSSLKSKKDTSHVEVSERDAPPRYSTDTTATSLYKEPHSKHSDKHFSRGGVDPNNPPRKYNYNLDKNWEAMAVMWSLK